MADAFTQNKRRGGKGVSYCIINTIFAVFFGLALFTLGKGSCYTTRNSNTPVDVAVVPEANDVKAWFNFTILLGFIFYSVAAVASLGYLMKAGFINTFSGYLEKLARMLTYFVFIAVHVMRLSHTGKVCSGDYLPSGASDEDVEGYMIATGSFFMTYIIIGWIMVPAMLIIMVCLKGEAWAALALDAPK
mmetsp:Transcript_34959/g.45998  ORF Transcript_34959/g.45998 Transcript_34959/m.45998 type:complete len:189 (+) Transcript_34959:30-596(+)|eukprot:CAMPEP_0185579576 /NCGR_PEP_ID=MMETSP0434-20130131/15268_1 /TAXON_ID=626734 ORGANISM="Favella taraikaensis, Strain Fe Narragansett Bay" /NCGR_SAMPLE_ID=MMETSP0434 /ASSEMBLY_ACC=CAM_ASM_000379 /LENGTH=188 /DNA_ID=CAMNT_0028197631 /DNA_START=37 /DNA_END=603 /DNA_ORIENTATION=+